MSELDSEVGAGSFGFQKNNEARQRRMSKRAIPTLYRVLTSGGTLELDLREDVNKKYWSNVM